MGKLLLLFVFLTIFLPAAEWTAVLALGLLLSFCWMHPVAAAAVASLSAVLLLLPRHAEAVPSIASRDEQHDVRPGIHIRAIPLMETVGLLVVVICFQLFWHVVPAIRPPLLGMAVAGPLCGAALVWLRSRETPLEGPWWREQHSGGSPAAGASLRLAPHPSRPWSLVTFVMLPVLLFLLSHLGIVLFHRYPWQPRLGHHDYADLEEDVAIPESKRDLAILLASRIGEGTRAERATTLSAAALLVWECPDYADRLVPLLATGLKDPDSWIRSITANDLAALGPRASAALPALEEARRTNGDHFARQVAEAFWWIEYGNVGWRSRECEPLSDSSFASGDRRPVADR